MPANESNGKYRDPPAPLLLEQVNSHCSSLYGKGGERRVKGSAAFLPSPGRSREPPNFNRPLRGCRFRRLRALAAEVVLVGRVFLQAVVEGMAHLRALRADKIDPLDRLVDSFAV